MGWCMNDELYVEAKRNIANFNIDDTYYPHLLSCDFIKSNDISNKVYCKDGSFNKNGNKVIFSNGVTNCRVYIGSNFRGNLNIQIQQNNCIVYVGDTCNLRDLEIRTQSLGSCVLIGNGVTTTGKNTWLTGSFPGSKYGSIVIGDDCLFSYDVTIRGSDGHPIMSFDFSKQINEPTSYVVVEPYVWIGQDVSIVKSVRIGGASIIGIASVVTRSIPRFSQAYGVPAKFDKSKGIWIKNRTPLSIETAKKYMDMFK